MVIMAKQKLIYVAAIPGSLKAFRWDVIKKISSEFEVVALSSEGPEQKELEDGLGIRTITVEIRRRPSLFKDIASLFKLYRIFRKERPFIVHSMSAKCGLVCMLAAKMAGVPHRVHSFTGLAFPTATGLSRMILITTEKLTCMSANHLLPEGKGVKEALQKHISKKEMTVLGYGNIRGIDLVKYDRTPEVISEAASIRIPNCFTFLFVGRIVRDKGINELVSAFCRLYKEQPQIRLLLVGGFDSGIDPIGKNTLEVINSHNGIVNCGRQDNVVPYYAAADCFVFPSYREGFPNVVIEAGAMGLPSVVTNIFGSNEIIEDGVNGLIVPAKDEDALYSAMKRVLEDEPLREKFASNARPMIESRYEEHFVQDCLIEYYHQIMQQ